jgi:hypothetical protein
MTDVRAGSINLIANARGDGTAAYVQAMHAVVDFLPDLHHIVLANAVAAIVEATQTITVQAADLHAVVEMAPQSVIQAGAMHLIAHINPLAPQVSSIYLICDAVRPKFGQASGINVTVNARSQSPRALANAVVAVANARSATTRAMTDGMAAIVSFQTEIQAQTSKMQAVASFAPSTQAQTPALHLVADGSARPRPQQAQIGSLFAVVNGVLAGEPHEYLPNRMRHGKRSKIGAISPYNQES